MSDMIERNVKSREDFIPKAEPVEKINMKLFRNTLFDKLNGKVPYIIVDDKIHGRVPHYIDSHQAIEDKEMDKLNKLVSDVVDEAMSTYQDLNLEKSVIKKIENSLSFEEDLKKSLARKLISAMPVYKEEDCYSKTKILAQNGPIDITTGEFVDVSENEIFLSIMDASYIPAHNTIPDIIWKYLKRVLGETTWNGEILYASDKRVNSFINILAYMMTASTSLKKMVFILGPTGTGKSTFMNFFSDMLSSYAGTLSAAALTHKPGRDPESQPGFIMVRNTHTAIGAEPGKKYVFADDILKVVTGRDKLSLRKVGGNNITFTPLFTICFTANFFPKLPDIQDEGMWSRFLICDFKNQFKDDEVDTLFSEKLNEPDVKNKFFSSLVKRASQFYQNGEKLEIDESFYKNLDFYKFHQRGSFENFFDGCCYVTGHNYEVTKANDIYERYISFCNTHDIEHMRKANFFKELKHVADITQGIEKVKSNQVPSSYRGIQVDQVCCYQYQQFVAMHKNDSDLEPLWYGGSTQNVNLNNQSIGHTRSDQQFKEVFNRKRYD
ncbi:MAG: phage/plasmid primase, P4 family [Spirochaetaceae bacterium]